MAMAVISLLASCGGGGGGCSGSSFAFGSLGGEICKNNQTSVSTVISGVTSGGGPLIGSVEITDSFGQMRGTPINADGTYKVDVSGMIGPFIVRAYGTVAGVPVTFYSAGTQEDVGGTINVTPFTDLILSSIAGRAIKPYLSDVTNIPRFASTLNPSIIRQTQGALFAMVRPILEQLGVTETVDLMRTVFKIDNSGLNTFMNFVKVEYDPLTPYAKLRNVITQAILVYIDVEKPISSSPIPQASYADITSSATADLQAIASVLRQIESLFESSLPTLEVLANSGLFVPSENFYSLDEDNRSFQDFGTKIISDPDNIGWLFRGWSLVSFSPDNEAVIDFKIIYKNKINTKTKPESLFFKKTDTNWRIVGAS
jgi:hypothetical protein